MNFPNFFGQKTISNQLDISYILQQRGRGFLSKLKQKAIRINNSWFRVLTVDKRRFIDAVIQTVDKIRSPLLLKLITAIAQKLLAAIGGISALIGEIQYGMLTFAYPQAQKISIIAQKWGNETASEWTADEGFIKYLMIMDMNNLPMFRIYKMNNL